MDICHSSPQNFLQTRETPTNSSFVVGLQSVLDTYLLILSRIIHCKFYVNDPKLGRYLTLQQVKRVRQIVLDKQGSQHVFTIYSRDINQNSALTSTPPPN